MLDPKWCVVNHLQDAENRWHFGLLYTVPVVLSQGFMSDDSEPRRTQATELEMAIKQFDDDDECWIYIGAEGERERSIILSVGSARRMARTLNQLLDSLDE